MPFLSYERGYPLDLGQTVLQGTNNEFLRTENDYMFQNVHKSDKIMNLRKFEDVRITDLNGPKSVHAHNSKRAPRIASKFGW